MAPLGHCEAHVEQRTHHAPALLTHLACVMDDPHRLGSVAPRLGEAARIISAVTGRHASAERRRGQTIIISSRLVTDRHDQTES
jgi:hypothetical protein